MTDTTDDSDRQSKTVTLYEAIGGDAAVRALTHRFYVLMDTLPEAARCRAVHPQDLSGSEEKLYEYLTGWLGGPPLYTQKRGHPMLRRRHFMASIGPAETLLMMAGQQGITAIVYTAMFAFSIVLNIVLIPRFGLVGAASAMSMALVAETIALYTITATRLGIRSSIFTVFGPSRRSPPRTA